MQQLPALRQIQHILIFITMIASPLNTMAQIEPDQWTDFEGTLGKQPIQLSLYRLDDGQLLGNYCYARYEEKIQLSGQINGSNVVITEYIDGKPNGHFDGILITDQSDRFEGIWTDPEKKKTLPFALSLQSVIFSEYAHRYNALFGTDEDIELFMKKVKKSILYEDFQWLADHVRYPLNARLGNGKMLKIKKRSEFLQKVNVLFNQKFKEKLRRTCACNLFQNTNGVMLGDGQIWVHNTTASTEEKFAFTIIAIHQQDK